VGLENTVKLAKALSVLPEYLVAELSRCQTADFSRHVEATITIGTL
jgi:hypothetical protein